MLLFLSDNIIKTYKDPLNQRELIRKENFTLPSTPLRKLHRPPPLGWEGLRQGVEP